MSPTEGAEPKYVLLGRSTSGELTNEGQDAANQHSPGGFSVETTDQANLTERETGIIEELRRLLPMNVVLPADNPFVVLKVSGEEASQQMMRGCACMCGQEGSCSGGGGGH